MALRAHLVEEAHRDVEVARVAAAVDGRAVGGHLGRQIALDLVRVRARVRARARVRVRVRVGQG